MEKWISLLITMVILSPSKNQPSDHGCSYKTLPTEDRQIICTNVTSGFFQYFALNLSKSRWLTCKICNLSMITNDTFNFPKNTINYLILIENNVINISNLAFVKLPLLKVLSLKRNFITTLNNGALYGIKRLLELDISDNKLKSLEDDVFADLENLDILNLNNNDIDFIEPNAFAGLVNLKYLYLNKNYIQILRENVFKYLSNLKLLYLENNQIAEIHPLAFNKLSNLNYLYLNNNSISVLNQYNFKPLASLIDLQLRFNNLSEIETSSFNGLKNIKFLYLGQNNLKIVKPYGFIGLNSLNILDLMDNKFEYFSLNYFKDMDKLNALWLGYNTVSNFSVPYQTNPIWSLKVITLEENQLESFNYLILHKKVPQLEEIWIGGNPWECDFIIEMYDYFNNNNITVCASRNCSENSIKSLIRKICFEPFQNETELSIDFVTDSANRNIFNYMLLIVSLLAYLNYFVIPTSLPCFV